MRRTLTLATFATLLAPLGGRAIAAFHTGATEELK